jgi:hypothetical protein
MYFFLERMLSYVGVSGVELLFTCLLGQPHTSFMVDDPNSSELTKVNSDVSDWPQDRFDEFFYVFFPAILILIISEIFKTRSEV